MKTTRNKNHKSLARQDGTFYSEKDLPILPPQKHQKMTGNTENFLLPYTKKEMRNYNYIIIIKQKQKPKIIFPQALKS